MPSKHPVAQKPPAVLLGSGAKDSPRGSGPKGPSRDAVEEGQLHMPLAFVVLFRKPKAME